jgi:hypothetical protein
VLWDREKFRRANLVSDTYMHEKKLALSFEEPEEVSHTAVVVCLEFFSK